MTELRCFYLLLLFSLIFYSWALWGNRARNRLQFAKTKTWRQSLRTWLNFWLNIASWGLQIYWLYLLRPIWPARPIHYCAAVTTFLLNCKDTPLPALTFSQFPLLFESPSPYGLIYPFLIGRVGERWRKIYSRIVYSRCPMMNHPSCLSTSPKVSH